MNDENARRHPEPTSGQGWLEPGKNNILLIYGLYLASLLVGVTALVGLILAYSSRGKTTTWIDTHYTWAIRTFWIGVLYSLISSALMIVGIGFLLVVLVAIWALVRIVIGLQRASREEPIANPQSWLI